MSSDTELQQSAAGAEGQVGTAEQTESAVPGDASPADESEQAADSAMADDGSGARPGREDESGGGAEEGQAEAGREDSDKLSNILAMRVPVIVKLAQKTLAMSDVMRFHLGSVIGFDKDAYEHVELMVNNHTIGLGQPVKIGENFGLRIVEITAVTETIKSLGEQPNED